MAQIYIYSPSGAVRDKAAFQRGLRTLTTMGHDPVVDPSALSSSTRFAGNDDERIAAIGRAASSGAPVSLITRGGYGLTRLLPRLPYKAIQRSIDRGMAWVGFSDFTALQLAVLAKTGGITWAGPALCDSFGSNEVDDITQACFDDLVLAQGEGAGWRMGLAASRELPARRPGLWAKDATLWGGNLTVMCGLLGTPHFPQVDGGILFLEDVGEHPYRIERLLTQLLLSGVIQRQKAIVLGQFTDFKLTPHDRGFGLPTVVSWLRSQTRVPVLTDLPFGHLPTGSAYPWAPGWISG